MRESQNLKSLFKMKTFILCFFGDFLILLFIQNAHLKVLCFLQNPSKIVLFHDFIDIQMQPKYSK